MPNGKWLAENFPYGHVRDLNSIRIVAHEGFARKAVFMKWCSFGRHFAKE